jgi:hypothetical protein
MRDGQKPPFTSVGLPELLRGNAAAGVQSSIEPTATAGRLTLAVAAAGEEVCLARRTESHAWEVICDVELLPDGTDITGVDIVDRPNDALQNLSVWD